MDRLKRSRGRQRRLSSNQRFVLFISSIVLLSGLGLLLGYIVANGTKVQGLDVSGASAATTATVANQSTLNTTVAALTPGSNQSPAITAGPTVTATANFAASPLPQGGAEVALSPSPDPAFIFTFEGSPAPTPGAASAPIAPANPVPDTTSATVSVVATDTVVPAPTETPTVATNPTLAETSPASTPTNPPVPATTIVSATNTSAPTATPTRPTPTVAAASAPLPTATATATSVPATATKIAPTATVKVTPTTVAPTATSVPATATPTTVAPTTTPSPAPATLAPTATANNTPALKVEYRTDSSQDSTTEIRPDFNLVNSGPDSVSLSDLTIHYWFTEDGDANQPQEYWCDYAVVDCANLTAHFVKLDTSLKGADSYLEIGFSSEAGSLQSGRSSGEIKSRFNKQDWSNYTQSNDYSFDPSKPDFAAWKHVTLYYKGSLVWGVEPAK